MSSLDDQDHRAAVRTIRLAVVAFGALLIGVTVLIAVKVADRTDGGVATVGGHGTPGASAGSIGPPAGADIAGYRTTRQAMLAPVGDADRRVAVVSFTRYRTEAEAASVLPTTGASVDVLARLVAVPGAMPEMVIGSLTDWAADETARVAEERSRIAELAPTVSDPEFSTFYASELVRLGAVAAAIDPGGPIVYGYVVVGKGADLRALAARAAVRLVDVGGSDRFDAKDTFRAPLPDEVSTIADPQTRPAPH
ncbi:MAG: hypothetical protein QOJ67_2188 [Acidimicrobiaceae bacterium]